MRIRYIDHPSKNFSDTDIKPEWIIIHCIGYEENKALGILSGDYPEFPVSAHYFVPQRELGRLTSSNSSNSIFRKMLNFTLHANSNSDNQAYPVYHLVPDTKKAWHAGLSHWGGSELGSFNECSIGIEFNLPNYANALNDPNNLNWYHFEEFFKDQIQAGISLIKDLIEEHGINPGNVLTHADIAAWRTDENNNPILGKTDPGAYFPMELLAQQGIGVWPKFIRTRNENIDTSVLNTQTLLRQVGYNVQVTGILDAATLLTIKAFKIHFMPESYTNNEIDPAISEKMIIGLENLVDRIYKYEMNVESTSQLRRGWCMV